MPASFRFALASFLVSVLSACGGGGDDAPAPAAGGTPPDAAAAPPPAGTTRCVPDRAAFEALRMGASRASVEQRIGCPGAPLDTQQVRYQWQDAAQPERFVRLSFDAGLLLMKEAAHIDTDSPVSSCVPSQAQFGAVERTATLDSLQRLFGCAPQHVGTLEAAGYREERYRWGRDAEGATHATVHLAGGLVIRKDARDLK